MITDCKSEREPTSVRLIPFVIHLCVQKAYSSVHRSCFLLLVLATGRFFGTVGFQSGYRFRPAIRNL